MAQKRKDDFTGLAAPLGLTYLFGEMSGGNAAEKFCALMEDIWDVDSMMLYDDWHNAVKTAVALGAKKLGSTRFPGSRKIGWVFEWEDGSQMVVLGDGSGVR